MWTHPNAISKKQYWVPVTHSNRKTPLADATIRHPSDEYGSACPEVSNAKHGFQDIAIEDGLAVFYAL